MCPLGDSTHSRWGQEASQTNCNIKENMQASDERSDDGVTKRNPLAVLFDRVGRILVPQGGDRTKPPQDTKAPPPMR